MSALLDAIPRTSPLQGALGSEVARPNRRRKIFERLYAVYIFMLMLLPTGSIFGVNVKFISFFFMFLAALQQPQRKDFRFFAFLVAPLLFLPWVVVGQLDGFALKFSLSQYKDITAMLLTCWVTLIYCAGLDRYRLQVIKLVLNAEITASIMKASIVLYTIVTGAPFTDITDWIDRVFKVQLTVWGGQTFTGRISFLSDIIIPACLFTLIAYRKPLGLSQKRAAIYIAMLLVSLVYCFSRYIWFAAIVAVLIALVASGKRDRFKLYVIGGIFLTVLALWSTLSNIVGERYDSALVDASDSVRKEQIPALEKLFSNSPVIGNGLGSYAPDFARPFSTTPYSYEVEWLALSAQLGIIGMIILIGLGALYFGRLFLSRLRLRQRLALGSVLLLWALGGFTNPAVTESVSAAAYSLIVALVDLRVDT